MQQRLYNSLGFVLFMWYIGFRWMIFYHEEWLYKPINIATSFVSIVFIAIWLFIPKKSMNWIMYITSIILLGRNLIYTIEDICDYNINPSVQNLCILIDVLMIIYVIPYILKYINGNYDEF